jgi:hypothetical protein
MPWMEKALNPWNPNVLFLNEHVATKGRKRGLL